MRTYLHRTTILATLFAAFGIASFASVPIANVSSSHSFALDGHAITADGVTSWPLVLGDDITTSAAPAVMSFPDGTVIKLAPQSRAKITGTAAKPKLVLVAGNMEYKLAVNSPLLLTNANPENPAAADGSPAPQNGPATVQVESNHHYILDGVIFAIALTALIIAIYDLENLPAASFR